MSTPRDQLMQALLQSRQTKVEQKQNYIAEAAQKKQQEMDPNFEIFNPDLYEVVDNDTFQHKRTGEQIRIQGQPGQAIDAFETKPRTYLQNPERFNYHRQAYGRLFGREPDNVTINELNELGQIQAQRLQQNKEMLRGVPMRRTDTDIYGRTLAQFEDETAFNQIKGQEGNAAYFAPFNYEGRAKDIVSGEYANVVKPEKRSYLRALTGDVGVNVAVGTGRLLNETAQGVSTLFGLNTEGMDEFFSNNRDRLEGVKQALSSDEQLFRERMDQKQSALNPELFELRKQKAIKEGKSPGMAAMSAGVDELADRIEYLKENPGRILDGFAESLPYMIGVGGAGRLAMNTAVKNIHGKMLEKVTQVSARRGVSESGEMLAKKAAENTARFLDSKAGKEILGRTAERTGMTTVGITEGLSTSADVYNTIINMTEEEAMQSEKYQALRFDQGMSHKDALESLAREASLQAFATVSVVAGAAGPLTGAAAFESKLFSRLADIRKTAPVAAAAKTGAEVAGEVTEAAVEKKAPGWIRRGAGHVGTAIKEVSKPGFKELGEEAIQSGGGELLGQLASADATGKPVGPGVGAATGEGAVIGFASGAGVQAVSSVAKPVIGGIADAVKGKDKYDKFTDPKKYNIMPASAPPPAPPPGGAGGGAATQTSVPNVPGGTVITNYQQQEQGNYDPEKEFHTQMQDLEKKFAAGNLDLSQYNSLSNHFNKIKNPKPEDQQAMDAYTSAFKGKLAAETQRITAAYKADTNSLTEDDKAMLRTASEHGVAGADSKNFGGTTGKALLHSENIAGLLDNLDNQAEQSKSVISAATGASAASVDQVIETKLGDGNSKYGLGLRAHKRLMSEAMGSNNKAKFEDLSKSFKKFILSQDSKIVALRNLIKNPNSTNQWGYKYVPGSTEGFLAILENEQKTMLQVREELVNQWHAWNKGTKLSAETTAKVPIAATTKVAVPTQTGGTTGTTEAGGETGTAETAGTTGTGGTTETTAGATTEAQESENPAPPDTEGTEDKKPAVTTTEAPETQDKRNPEVTAALNKAREARDAGNHAESVKILRAAVETAEKSGDTRVVGIREALGRAVKRANKQSVEKSRTEKAERKAKKKAKKQGTKVAQVDKPAKAAKPATTSKPLRTADELINGDMLTTTSGRYFRVVGGKTESGKSYRVVETNIGGTALTNKVVTVPIKSIQSVAPRAELASADITTEPETESPAPEGETVTETTPEDEAVIDEMRKYQGIVDDADRQIAQLNATAEEGGITAEQVFFGDPNVQRQFLLGYNKYILTMTEKEAALAALNVIRNFYDAKIDRRVNYAFAASDTAAEDALVEGMGTLLNDSSATIPASDTPDVDLPFAETDEKPDSDVLPNTFAKIKELLLPRRLKDAFEKAKKKTRSLLAAIPNLATLLSNPNTRTRLANELKLLPREKGALDGFAAFREEFGKVLNEILGDITKVGQKTRATSRLFLASNLRDSPLYYLMQNGQLESNVVTAIALQALNWLGTEAGRSLFNDDEAINALLNRDANHDVTSEERARLRQGTLLTGAVNTIGKAIAEQMNIRQKDPTDPANQIDNIFTDRLINSLGVAAIATLRQAGYLNIKSVPNSWWQKQAGNTSAKANDNSKVLLVYPTPKSQKEMFTPNTQNETAQEIWKNGRTMFERMFGTSTMGKEPSLTEPTDKDIPTRVRNSLSNVPKRLQEAIGYNHKLKWKSEGGVVRVLKRMDAIQFLKSHGYKDNMDVVHVDDVEAVQATNAGLLRDLEQALKWANETGRKSFYFTMYVTASGRVHIDSNTINPQSSKIHRFLFSMQRWNRTVKFNANPGTEGYKRWEDFIIAVGLGLKIDAGKLSREEVIQRTQDMLNETNKDGTPSEISKALDILQQESDEPMTDAEMATISPFLKAGTHSLAALVAWNQYRKAMAAGETAFETSLPMAIDGVTNGVSAGALQTPPLNETNYEKNKTMLRATGVFFAGDLQNYPEWRQVPGHQDNYQNTAGQTGNNLEQMATGNYTPAEGRAEDNRDPEWQERDRILQASARKVFLSGLLPSFEELLTDIGRTWAKDPLMIVAYMASVYSVVNKVVENALIQFRSNLASANAPRVNGVEITQPSDEERMEVILRVMNQAAQIMSATEQANRTAGVSVKTQTWTGFTKMTTEQQTQVVLNSAKKNFNGDLSRFAREFKLSEEDTTLLEDGIKATYGEALTNTLHEQLKPVEEIRKLLNEANALMNIMFVEDFTRRVAALEKIRGVFLNRNDINKLLEQMFAEGMVPSVATPLSDGIADNLETTKYGTRVLSGDAAGVVYFSDLLDMVTEAYEGIDAKPTEPKRQESLRAAITSKIPITDVGVGAVVKLIHSTDGATNASVWGKHPASNLHDSIMTAFDDIDAIGTELNENYLNLHRTYSLAAEIGKSLDRMLVLLDANDFRLTAAQKQTVHNKYMEFLVKRKVHEEAPANAAQETRNRVRRIHRQIGAVLQARAKLFGPDGVKAVNQFAKQGTTHVVDDSAKRLKELSDAEFAKAYEEAYKEDIRRAAERDINGSIETLIKNMEGDRTGDPTKPFSVFQFRRALTAYLDEKKPDALQMLHVLTAVFNRTGHPAGATLSLLNNLFKDYLKAVPGQRLAIPINLVPAGTLTNKAAGIYDITNRVIKIDRDIGVHPAVLFHEIIHAALQTNLEEMEARNSTRLAEMLSDIKRFTANLDKGSDIDKIVSKSIREPGDNIKVISEYMAYVFSTQSKNNKYIIEYLNRALGADIKDLDFLNTLGKIVADPQSQNIVLRSSSDEVSETLFKDSVRNLLEADKVQEVFAMLEKLNLGPTDPQEQARLKALIDNFLVPGLRSIEPVFTMLEINPNGSRNIGDVRSGVHEHIVRVEAAGNQLTNNVDMSLQEVLAHELSHAIMKAAVNGNPKIRQAVKKLYEQARDSEAVTVESFMQEGWTGDPDAARAAAQERYNHIFRNEKGDNLHEFMAIALTNKAFATILSTINDRNTREPIWEGGILKSIVNLFNRAVAWITGNIRRADKANSIHQSVLELADEILAFNQRNLARVNNEDPSQYRINRIDNAIRGFVDAQLDRLQQKLRRSPQEIEGGPGSGFKEVARATTHAALVLRTDEGQRAIRGYIKQTGVSQNSLVVEVLSEVMPYNQDNLGTNEGKPGWIDLLRKSKILVDTATQRMFEHVRGDLLAAFDKKKYLKSNQREALNNVVLKTDLVSLMEANPNLITVGDLQDFLRNRGRVDQYLTEIQQELKTLLAGHQRGAKLYEMFNTQTNSLANFMVRGEMLIEHGMQNANNIVNQYNLIDTMRSTIPNKARAIQLVDAMATLKALQITPSNDLDIANEVIAHEMSRELVENGFYTLVGMHSNFKKLSLEQGFKNNPTQMIKGYTYEMTDEDINLESILDTPAERRRMRELGMVEIGPNKKSPLDDPDAPNTVMFKGVRGLAGYQKSVVSLTDPQSRGENLFATYGYNSKQARRNINRIRREGYSLARKQANANWTDKGTHLVPILDEDGNITDYRYMMSEANKKQHLKKKAPFDQVMGRMYGSVTNRKNSKQINRDVVALLKREYEAFKDSPEHTFIEIGKHAKNQDARDMYNLLPKDMQLALEEAFGGTSFPIRDNTVNLVMGFRKLSFANNEFLGKNAFVVKAAEKIWQEVIQYVRIKAAILNPAVVVANIISNYIILLSEGIPVTYIKRMTGEAIFGMKTYQEDIRRYDTLNNRMGVERAMGKDVKYMQAELARIEQDIRNNPVGDLVREGLFTNIVEDMGTDERSLRERTLGKALDVASGVVPRTAVAIAREVYMLPGSKTFNAALAATQYGDFIGRYIKFKYDTEVRKTPRMKAIHDALSTFIYYDIPQNRWLQAANDYGFAMFTKFFLRIQPVIGRIFAENPTKAFGIMAVQQALMPAPFEENIGKYAFFHGATRRFEPFPLLHVDKIEPFEPSLFKWLLGPFGF